MSDELREELAALIHLQWRQYMSYHLNQFAKVGEHLTIPAAYYNALWKQTGVPYMDLSEEDKDKDRREADKVLTLIRKHDDALRSD